MHDFNGGIQPSGLFWVVELSERNVDISHDGRTARMRASNVAVQDSFSFVGTPPPPVPAIVSFSFEWRAVGPFQDRGKGKSVPSTDPAAFTASFARASVRGSFSGRELGFSFESNPDVTDRGGYALMGRERNGSFLAG